jgi:lysophospholipase L1-like esterase
MKESTPPPAHRVARRNQHRPLLRNPVIRILSALLVLLTLLPPLHGAQKTYRIMPVGDSITEGGESFSNWRYPLWEKLFSAGYLVEYVGSRKSPSRIGDLAHEGYGGKNSGFLAATVPGNFKKHPADVVLLHAGHNQFADQKPVPRIVEDTEELIAGFRAVNPEVIVLLAQPITSGKLPKYSYIPELHGELAKLASRLDRAESPVRIVPQGEGFDPHKDTVADLVHPNESGAAKMAGRWFEALVKVLENPGTSF